VYDQRLPNGVAPAPSPIVTADGRLYFAGGGKSVVVQAGPKYEALGTGDLGDSSNASPAVADGKLFIKGGRNLYCIGKK
jgi:outer membrane protein assembly factor BamB